MDTTWILISDARHARCFERQAADHALIEQADFVHSSPQKSTGAQSHASIGSKGHGRTGHAGTQFEPHTESHAKERASFARQLAEYLNEGVSSHRCNALVLIATGPMLGEIRPCLSEAAEKVLKNCVTGDLTHYTGPELQARVNRALERSD